MARGVSGSRSNVGIAISATRVTAWLSRGSGSAGGEEWKQEIAPMPPTASEWPELEVALRALLADSGGGSLFIALLPPLSQVKAIALPPVSADDAGRLVTRSAGKYFVGAREPQVVGVEAFEGEKGAQTHALASAASMRLVEAVRDAADGAGWKVARIIPAHTTWLNAADHVWASSDALIDHGRVVIMDDERTDVIFKQSGRIESFRHFRGVSQDRDGLLEAVGTRSGADGVATGRKALRPVAFIGSEGARRQIAPALRESGLVILEPDATWNRIMSSPALAAAHFAPLTEELELVTEQARTTRAEKHRKTAVILGIAAAVLILASFGAKHVGMERELAMLTAKRDSIREVVTEVREAQRKIATVAAPVASVDSIRSNATRWSLVLSDVAQNLPMDAYLTSMSMARDSINMVGEGKDASSVFASLRRAPALQQVRQAGQIRTDNDISYFSLVATVRKDTNGAERP